MATRAVDGGKMPQEIFDLGADERWQARLDEARARREIALREKASGKPQKKRLKPWETEGTAKPVPIEPIIQEREDDRVDFADRVDSIRAVVKKAPKEDEANVPRSHNWARLVEEPTVSTDAELPKPKSKPSAPAISLIEAHKPPSVEEFDDILTDLPVPRTVEKDLSLVRADAPEISELASRYAATLEPEGAPEILPETEVAAEPKAVVAPEPVFQSKPRRPLILISAVAVLAMVPFATKAPPLDKGPAVTAAPIFAFQPALGVTWSMQQPPKPTRSGEWRPRVASAPIAPIVPIDGTPAQVIERVTNLSAPELVAPIGQVKWTDIASVRLGAPTQLYKSPPVPAAGPSISDATVVEPGPVPAKVESQVVPAFEAAPPRSRPVQMSPVAPDTTPEEASLLPPTVATSAKPLKVTILRPSKSDQKIAATIARDVANLGHDLVQVKEVNHSIKSRNVRYFYASDRPHAAKLAKTYDAELRDFTWYDPKPSVGTAELWLTGKSAPVNNPARTARPRNLASAALQPPAPQRVLLAPQPVIETRKRGLLSRIFGRHKPSGVAVNTDNGDNMRTGSNTGGGTSTSAGSDTGTTVSTDTGSGDTDTVTTDAGTGGVDTGTGGTDTGTSSDAGSGGINDTGSTDTGTSGTDTGTDSGTDTGTTNGSDGSDTSGSGGSDTSSGGDSSGGGSTDSGSSDSDSGSSGRGNGNNGNGNSNGNGKGGGSGSGD